jgi:hypothetical protein
MRARSRKSGFLSRERCRQVRKWAPETALTMRDLGPITVAGAMIRCHRIACALFPRPGDRWEARSAGEWHFAWILEGRAIQDVWISPSKANRAHLQNGARNRYGTSLRSFDPAQKKWRVTWTNPISGSHDVLWTHRDGPNIVMEGVDDQGRRMRWGFSDIRWDSARWYGERSADGGKSWKLEAEFFLQKVSTLN